MGPEKSRDDDNLPSPFEESDGHRLTDKENEASQASHAYTDSASMYLVENMYETVQSFTEDPAICKNGSDFMSFGTLQSSQVLGDGLINQDLCDTGYQNPRVNVNYFPSECTVGSFEMNEQERVANRNWSQTAASSGASVLNSTIEVVPSNDINVEAFHPSNSDGNFLALGLGGDAGYREERFSSREFPCTVSPQNNSSYVLPDGNSYVLPASNSYVLPDGNSYVLPASNSYVLPASTNSYPSQTSTQDFLGFQRSPGAFPRPMFNTGGWTSHYNDEESATVNWDNLGLVQNPYPYPFYSPSHAAPDHYHFSGNIGFAANSPGINPTMTVPAGYQGSPAPSSLPFNSFNTNYPHPGFASHHDLASESAKPIWTPLPLPPPTYQLQNPDDKNDRVSFSNHPAGRRGGFATHDYLGLPTLPVEGFSSHALESIPPSLGVHSFGPTPTVQLNPAHGVWNSTSDKFGLHNGKHHAIKPVKAEPLTSIQLDNPAQFNQGIPILRQTGPQAKNNMIQDQSYKPPDNARVSVGLTSGSGPQDIILPPPNAPRPLYTGPGPSRVQVHQQPQTSSYITSKSSLKRRAAEPPKVPSWGRRRKYMHVPPHSTNNGTQGVAVTQSPPPAISYVAHIKFSENVESPPKLTGWDCLICKLDLSFAPDNPEHQPTITPAVAVLPCGHTFHDQCLSLITPADQAKDPPCIPCAMGEN